MDTTTTARTESALPGLDIAQLRSWQHYLESTLRVSAVLNKEIVAAHGISLTDVRLLDLLSSSETGSIRMGDLAEELLALPSRITRQIRRLESGGYVVRRASPTDGRGVLASITDDGRALVTKAVHTYGEGVRRHYLGRLTRPQMTALGDHCRRLNAPLR